jgi:hypothetical protein
MMKSAEKLDALMLELFVGPKPLTQEELDRKIKAGISPVEIERDRYNMQSEKQLKFANELKSLILLMPDIKAALPDYMEKNMQSKKSKRAGKVNKPRKVTPVKQTEQRFPKTMDASFFGGLKEQLAKSR